MFALKPLVTAQKAADCWALSQACAGPGWARVLPWRAPPQPGPRRSTLVTVQQCTAGYLSAPAHRTVQKVLGTWVQPRIRRPVLGPFNPRAPQDEGPSFTQDPQCSYLPRTICQEEKADTAEQEPHKGRHT